MSAPQKVNAGTAITKSLALGRQGSGMVSEGLEKLQVTDKLQMVKEHAVVTKVAGVASKYTNVLWAVLGLVMVLQGAQFKNLYLCFALIKSFYYDRVKSSISELISSVTTALDKMKADSPDEPNADAKAEAKPDNKHAAKRQQKKDAPSDKSAEENVAAAKKALKAMDSQSLSNAIFEVCSAAMAAHMVMHTRLGQAVVLAHSLVQVAMEKTEKFVEFTGHEEISVWVTLFLKFVFYCFFIGCALIVAPFALALDISIFGAQLLVQSGAKAVQAFGKLEDAEAFLASTKGLGVMGGTVAFGTLWQFWSLMADSGMAWYFQLAYLPAVIAESIVGCF